jgi:hypothetical protein
MGRRKWSLTGVKKDSATNRARAFNWITLALNHQMRPRNPRTYEELHLRYLLVHFLHELDDKVDQLVLQHSFCMEVRDQERDVISLEQVSKLSLSPVLKVIWSLTLTGFLRKMKNDSARCVKNLVNLCTRICSISSACLILMLTRTLFTLGSIRTFSFSFREIVRGLRRSSGEL